MPGPVSVQAQVPPLSDPVSVTVAVGSLPVVGRSTVGVPGATVSKTYGVETAVCRPDSFFSETVSV